MLPPTLVLGACKSCGQGGLLDALTATNAAAPGALPSLILLNRQDMETAALKGLILPLDDMTAVMGSTDWYPYAQDLARLQGSIFGLPFAGDALALVYRPVRFPSPPKSWNGNPGRQRAIAISCRPETRLALQMLLSTGRLCKTNKAVQVCKLSHYLAF